MMTLVNGKQIADLILTDLRGEISRLREEGLTPTLAVFLVGREPASLSYVKIKTRRAHETGIKVALKQFNADTEQAVLEEAVRESAGDANIHAILVQLPLPRSLDKEQILNLVPPAKDVDSLSRSSKTAAINGGVPKFYPPAASAIMEILNFYKIDLKGKNILIVGTGELVGRPLAAMLLAKKIDFELANKHTENLEKLLGRADIIVSGTGKAGLIKGEMLKKGAVVIDAGTAGSEIGEITGDVEKQSVLGVSSLLAAVPGGVGPVTVAMLLKNVVEAAKNSRL